MTNEEMLKLVKESQQWDDAADWKDNSYRVERLLDEVPGLIEVSDYAKAVTEALSNLVELNQGEFDLRDIDASVKAAMVVLDTYALSNESKRFSTWDEVVECGDVSSRQRTLIESLGFYGKEIKKGDVKKILEGVSHAYDKPYNIIYNGMDGSCTEGFDDLAAAVTYVKERYQYWKGQDGFGTDYANYSLEGFTMKDCEISYDG